VLLFETRKTWLRPPAQIYNSRFHRVRLKFTISDKLYPREMSDDNFERKIIEDLPPGAAL
jgi:hypothetical protein